MMDLKLLNYINCPDCGADVAYKFNDNEEQLICTKCKRIFKVTDSIPEFIVAKLPSYEVTKSSTHNHSKPPAKASNETS